MNAPDMIEYVFVTCPTAPGRMTRVVVSAEDYAAFTAAAWGVDAAGGAE